MDACEIANFLAKELFMQQFVSLDANQGGVPTLTTSTLTPTTLRNIEQTFIELTNDTGLSTPYQAGFVPPPAPFVNFVDNSNDNNSIVDGSSESESQSSWQTPIMHEENSMATDTSSHATSIHGSPGLTMINSSTINGNFQTIQTSSPQNRRNTGGRRATKLSNLSPEEEEKRRVRRERNKAAAARCRKRRVDQTNDLLEKVDKLEKEKEELQKDIETYTIQQDELKYCLQAHRAHCRRHHTDNGIGQQNQQQASTSGARSSPIDVKPNILDQFETKVIKDEPIDTFDSLDGPTSPPKRILLSSNPLIPPPLPNVSTITGIIGHATTPMLNTPTITRTPPPLPPPSIVQTTTSGSIFTIKTLNGSSKARPSSLNVPMTMAPSQAHLNKFISECGVPITTPSSGVMFNFDSLMDGGTGLTPVSGPLMPTCSSSHTNKHPLELTMTTPTSEPSKLVSL